MLAIVAACAAGAAASAMAKARRRRRMTGDRTDRRSRNDHARRGRIDSASRELAMSVRWKWLGLWAAVVAAEAAALSGILQAEEPVPGYRVVFRLIGGVFCACGLIAWRRRPDSRSGLLMRAAGCGRPGEPGLSPRAPGRAK